MQVTVEPTYEMSKVLGVDSFEVRDVKTVAELIEKAKRQVGPEFERLTRLAGVAVNGVLVSYMRGMKTELSDGDVVAFVMAAAGG